MNCMRKWTTFHKVWRIASFFLFTVFRQDIRVCNNKIRLYALGYVENVKSNEHMVGVKKHGLYQFQKVILI